MKELQLTPTQQLRRELLDKYQDIKSAKEAFEFIAGGEALVTLCDAAEPEVPGIKVQLLVTLCDAAEPEVPGIKVQLLGAAKTADRDGVYLVTKYNRLIPYGNPSDYGQNQFVGVGLKVGDMAIRIGLKDQKDVTLTNRTDDGETGSPCYCDDWDNARILRPDGRADTEHIKAVGTDIELAPDEYIPSLYELYQMFVWRKILDGALEFIGGEPFEDEWYWSSTECSATGAWGLYFGGGGQGFSPKASDRGRVRPVSAL